jgi:transcriptional regulator with XRE-family HTH domain
MTYEIVRYAGVTLRHAIREDVRVSRRRSTEGAAVGSKRNKRTHVLLSLELVVTGVIGHYLPKANAPLPQNLRNRKCALRRAQHLVGIGDQEPACRLLGPALETSIAVVRRKLKDKPKLAGDTISHLRWFDREASSLYPHALAKDQVADASEGARKRIESKFKRFLRDRMKQRQLTVAQLAKQSAIPDPTIRSWLKGKLPGWTDHARLEALAKALECTTGELLTFARRRLRRDAPAQELSEYGQYLVECSKLKFTLQEDEVSAQLRAEWARLLEHQVEEDSEFVRSDRTGWRAQVWPNNRRGEPRWFEVYEGLHVPSADAYWRRVQAYLGWLRLPKEAGGMGLDLAQCQTLAWLAQPEAVKRFIAWLEKRAGKTNMGARNLRQAARSLCAERCGWLRQQPEFRERLPESFRSDDWAKMCDTLLRILGRHARKKVERTRDPIEGLAKLLELDDPCRPLMDMIRELCEEADSYRDGTRAQAIAERDAAQLAFLMMVPARLTTLAQLTVGTRKNQVWIEDGALHVNIPPEMLKNGEVMGRLKPDPIKSELVEVIARYLRRGRLRLTQGVNTELFLVSCDHPDLIWTGASERLVDITKRFLYEYVPYGIPQQSMRHLIASRYLKLNPGQYQGAASLLHDTLHTVLQTYAPKDPTGAFGRNAGSFGLGRID